MDTIFDLVSLFHGGNITEGTLKLLADTFSNYDNTFASDQIEEMRVLAGAILKCLVEKNDSHLFFIEILEECYKFLGKNSLVNDISIFIEEDLNKNRLSIREDMTFDILRINKLKDVDFKVVEGQAVQYNEVIQGKLALLVDKVNDITTKINKIQSLINKKEQILYEDSQILWWLISEFSDEDEKKYSEIDMKKAAILAGRDLANKVRVMPGPYSAKGVLNKLLYTFEKKQNIDFKDYVDSCDDKIIETLVDDSSVVYTPLLYALQQKKVCGVGNWYLIFERKFNKFDNLKYSVVDLAYEMYNECININN